MPTPSLADLIDCIVDILNHDHGFFRIGNMIVSDRGDVDRDVILRKTVREIESAEKQEAEARDKIWRENFCPHAIILTEKTVPSPIFVAAIIGIEKLLRIDLDATQGPVSFVKQVLDRLPEGVPAFGKTAGFVINYSPDKAVRFDPNGQPIAILDKAARPGTAVLLRLGGQPIHEALGLIVRK